MFNSWQTKMVIECSSLLKRRVAKVDGVCRSDDMWCYHIEIDFCFNLIVGRIHQVIIPKLLVPERWQHCTQIWSTQNWRLSGREHLLETSEFKCAYYMYHCKNQVLLEVRKFQSDMQVLRNDVVAVHASSEFAACNEKRLVFAGRLQMTDVGIKMVVLYITDIENLSKQLQNGVTFNRNCCFENNLLKWKLQDRRKLTWARCILKIMKNI